MKYLVTGGAGFIGSHIVSALLEQGASVRILDNFSSGRRENIEAVLVATDVAARGIDVTDITHVIHYNLPEDVENYTHRSGRTARAGKKGVSIALVNTKEMYKIKSIERIIKSSFNTRAVPSPDQICEIRLIHMVNKIADVPVESNRMKKFMPAVMEKLDAFSKEELVQRFVSDEFNRLLDYYSGAVADLSTDSRSQKGSDRNSSERGRREDRYSDNGGSFSKGRRESSRTSENF